MKLLLDTHTLLWWLSADTRLGPQATALIADPRNDVLISTVVLWELVVKMRVGKLEADIGKIVSRIEADGFALLDIAPAHLHTLAGLPAHHRDPFDHLLIAQAITEQASFVSEDRFVKRYPVTHVACSGPAA